MTKVATRSDGKPTKTTPPTAKATQNDASVTKLDAAQQPERTPTALTFSADKGASRSVWIAAFLLIAIVSWMGSGFILPSEDATPNVQRETPKPIAVAVAMSSAQTVPQFYQAEGQTLPDRDTILRAETSGDIVEVLVSKGQDVEAGEVIARIDSTSNTADANRAAQELARAQREFDNAESLLERGVSTADRVSRARADLANAQAQVTAAQQAGETLTITAPFAGRIETLDLNESEFVSAGAEVGRLVDIDPLTVAIQVPQQSLTLLSVGQAATVRFITGEERSGVVAFVGTSAAAETRTFLAEIEVANEDGAIAAGISAQVTVPTGETTAHFVTPSIVSLDTAGTLGVKTVDADNVVQFYPVEIVKAQIDGIWVTGLPDEVNLITIGQGFVNESETVAPMPGEQS